MIYKIKNCYDRLRKIFTSFYIKIWNSKWWVYLFSWRIWYLGEYDPCTGTYDVSTAAGFHLKFYSTTIEIDPSSGKINAIPPFAQEDIINDNELFIFHKQYDTIERLSIKVRPDLEFFLNNYIESFTIKDIVSSLKELEKQNYIQRYTLVCCITPDGSLYVSENPLVPLDGSTHFTAFENYPLRTSYS